MKKVGDIMREAGFNPEGKDSVKEAFIKYLIKASTGISVATPSEKQEMRAYPESILSLKVPLKGQQLSFNFEEEAPSKPKKASTF